LIISREKRERESTGNPGEKKQEGGDRRPQKARLARKRKKDVDPSRLESWSPQWWRKENLPPEREKKEGDLTAMGGGPLKAKNKLGAWEKILQPPPFLGGKKERPGRSAGSKKRGKRSKQTHRVKRKGGGTAQGDLHLRSKTKVDFTRTRVPEAEKAGVEASDPQGEEGGKKKEGPPAFVKDVSSQGKRGGGIAQLQPEEKKRGIT